MSICGGICICLTLLYLAHRVVPEASYLVCGEKRENYKTVTFSSETSKNLVGVNLGGWLCLEDWFHSGSVGRHVSTPPELERGQGACLPPIVRGPLSTPWPSEGILVHRLNESHGPDYAAEALTAFRQGFITEDDLDDIAGLGIRSVRIPFSWAMFAEALAPVDADVYGSHDPEWEPVVVPDPFHHRTVKMVTVARHWFKALLQKMAKRDLKIILDLHNMPGGSSDGTYSGVWPLQPAFWRHNSRIGNTSVSLREIGDLLVAKVINWVETDPVMRELVDSGHIRGLCFMNEPGHLAGIPGQKWGVFAKPEDVLDFVTTYSSMFRRSSLPSKGVRLYIQLIETAWPGDEFQRQVPGWYHASYSDTERNQWAVMARHFYTAWGCTGTLTHEGKYQCDENIDNITAKLSECIYNFSSQFAQSFNGLRAVTEWSLGTHADANLACSNPDVLRTLFDVNVQAFALIKPENQVEPVFWSWKMPYGPKFQPGWSLKSFAGLDEASDTNGRCVVGPWAVENPLQLPAEHRELGSTQGWR